MTLNKCFYICRLLITGTKSQACIGPIPKSEGDAGLCCYAAVRQKLIAIYPFAVQLISSASDMDRWLQSHDEMDELLSSILVINRQNVSFNRGRTTIVGWIPKALRSTVYLGYQNSFNILVTCVSCDEERVEISYYWFMV